MHDCSCLLGLEFILRFDLVIELATSEEFEDYVERVLGLENLVEFHSAFVIKTSHDLDLFYQALFSILFAIGSLFRKCLNSIVCIIFQFLSQINRSKITLTNLLDRFELLMKSSLINFSFKYFSPVLQINLRQQIISTGLLATLEFDLQWFLRECKLQIEIKLDRLIWWIRSA